MSVFSGTTALYVGNNSYSAAYVGDVQVWPLINGREVYAVYGSGSTENDLYLGINSSTTLKYRFRGKLTSYTGGAHICSQTSPDSNDYRFFVVNRAKLYLDMGNQRLTKNNFYIDSGLTGTEIDLTISNFSVYDNISQTTVISGGTVSSVPQSEMRMLLNHLYVEAFQAWEGDTLISDCVPFVKSDGTIGLYDKVSGRFLAPDSQTNVYYLDPPSFEDYLTFEILTGGTIQLSGDCASAQTVQYRVNNGSWNTMTVCGATQADAITVSTGDIVEWKGNNNTYGGVSGGGWFSSSFKGTSYFNASGRILSLFYGDHSPEYDVFPPSSLTCFGMFNGSNVVSAENLILPSTVKDSCYNTMFCNCTSLTTAPSLPATDFDVGIFGASGCYDGMFMGCTSLTMAPDLPAATLVLTCYNRMFSGCTSLKYVKCLATDISASNCLHNWLTNVATNGTFVKKSGVTFPTGSSGIPNNWTIIEE